MYVFFFYVDFYIWASNIISPVTSFWPISNDSRAFIVQLRVCYVIKNIYG